MPISAVARRSIGAVSGLRRLRRASAALHDGAPAPGVFLFSVSLVAVTLAVVAGAPRALASCNLIPVAEKTFPSQMGAVTSPITASGRVVELSVTSCDASAGFEPNPFDNDVELQFEPPGVGSDTTVAVDSGTFQVSDCTLPGGRCSRLSFATPDTTAILPPHGLAGPARIIVRDAGNAVVAEIGELFLPALSCDREPETVFEQFVVLPAANSFADAVSGAQTEIRATVGGGGDLLVPFDYWGDGLNSVLAETPGAPVAIFLEGNASVPAQGAGDTDTIADVIGQQPSPSSFVRSFTLDGRPLPPLLRITDAGALLGSADAIESVLYIARNDGEGGPNLYDLGDRLFMDRGPVLITTFDVARNSPIPLAGLRSSAEIVAFARDESRESTNLNGDSDTDDLVMEVLDPSTGASTTTGKAVVETSTLVLRPSSSILEQAASVPAAVASGDLAAFLEYESDQDDDINADLDFDDSFLRVYRRDGLHLTASLDVEAAPVSVIDNRTVGVAASRVFFRSPNPLVEVIENGDGGLVGMQEAKDVALSPDGQHVYVAAFDPTPTIAVFERDAGTGRLTLVEEEPVPLAGGGPNTSQMFLAVSPDGNNVYVGLMPLENTLTVFDRDVVTGALTFVEQHRDGVAGVDGLGGPQEIVVSADGENVYVAAFSDDSVAVFARDGATGALTFLEVERQGVNGVNGLDEAKAVMASPDGAHVYVLGKSGGFAHTVLFDRDQGDGTLTFVQGALTAETLLAAAMSPDGANVYGFGSSLIVYTRDSVTGQLAQSQVFGGPLDDVNGVPGIVGGGLTVSPDGTRVYTAAANLDGAFNVFARAQATGTLTRIASYFENVGGLRGLASGSAVAVAPDEKFIYVAATPAQGAVVVLRNDLALRAFDADTQLLRAGQPLAASAAVAAGRALLLTPENLTGADLNGDGDELDDVVQLFDATGPADVVTPLGVASTQVALSDEIAAMTVREASQDDTDLNLDGDRDDEILFVAEADGDGLRNTMLVADKIAVSGRKVILFARTSGVGSLSVYDFDADAATLLSDAVRDFVIRGPIVAFRVVEFAFGEDLNGDGNDDLGMLVYDTDTGEILKTRHAAERCSVPACEPQLPYSIDLVRNTLTFLENETLQGLTDLNGDGDALDVVLQVFSLRARKAQTVATVTEDGVVDNALLLEKLPPFPEPFLSDDVLFHHVRESEIGQDIDDDGAVTAAIVMLVSGDVDGDGLFDDYDGCVERANPDGLDVDGDALGDSACDPDPTVCPPAPLAGCKAAPPEKAGITIKNSLDDTKDSVTWKWSKGEATTLADIGNPVGGVPHYSLCVYDASADPQPRIAAATMAQLVCDGAPCWKATGTKGYAFKDKSGRITGTQQMKLTSGAAGKAKAQYKGRGAALAVPGLPPTTPVTAQLIVNEGERQECWTATFSTFTKSDAGQFKAKSD